MTNIKNIFRSIIFWLIILLISTALILTSIISDTNKIKNQPTIKINNLYIHDNDIEIIINNLWKKKQYKNIEKIIKNKIINNLSFHITIRQFITTTNKELIHSIYNLPQLQINGNFSYKLYTILLKQIKLNEYQFQKNIKNLSLKNQIKECLKLSYINLNNKETKKLIKFKYIKNSIDNSKNKNIIKEHETFKFYKKNYKYFFSLNNYKIEYIQISIKNIINHTNINDNKLKKHHTKYNKHYKKQKLIKLEHIFIKKNQHIKTKNLINDIKNNHTFIQLINKYDQSKKTSKRQSGWINENELNNNIEKIAFNIKDIEEISNIIKTKQGIHIIKLKDKTIKHLNDKNKIIQIDITNTFKRLYTKKYIIENYINTIKDNFYNNTHIKITDILNIKRKYIYISQSITKKNIIKNNYNNNIIKIKNNNYIIFKIIKNKKYNKFTFNKNKFLIKKYLQKINKEKTIIKFYNNITNNKTNKKNIKWINVNNKNINNYNIPRILIKRILKTKISNSPIIKKIKNDYYYIIIKHNTNNIQDNNYIKYEYQAYKDNIIKNQLLYIK